MTKQEGLKIAAGYNLEWEFEFSYQQGIDFGMTEEEATVFVLFILINEWDI